MTSETPAVDHLSHRGIVRIDACNCCGEIHVNVGPLTVRLARAHFEDLVAAVASAGIELQAREIESLRPGLRLVT